MQKKEIKPNFKKDKNKDERGRREKKKCCPLTPIPSNPFSIKSQR